MQIDVDIGSSSVARSIIGLVLGYVTSIVVDLAILIEVNILFSHVFLFLLQICICCLCSSMCIMCFHLKMDVLILLIWMTWEILCLL